MQVRRVQTAAEVQQAYPCATEDPIPFWADGLSLSREWFAGNLGSHVEGFHLEDEEGHVMGHIYWAPGSQALVPYEIEDGVAYLYCDWVQRRHQGQGGMRLLFQEFIKSLDSQGYKGILVDGTEIEGYMHYRHFLKRGFQVIREREGSRLLYYPLHQASVRVRPIEAHTAVSEVGAEVLVIGSRFCPVGASAVLAVRKVVQELGGGITVREIPASREVIAQYGVADGIWIKGKAKFFGPVTEAQVRRAIEEELEER